jgi:transposase InsO family protein
LRRATAWFVARGVVVRRVLTDNAKSYRVGKAWIAAYNQLDIARRFTKLHRPWTNGKAERFNRTRQTEWAYAPPGAATTSAPQPWTACWSTTTLPAATPPSGATRRSADSPREQPVRSRHLGRA